MEVDRNDFFHAVFDVLRREEVRLALPLHGHLPHVLQQNRGDGFGRAGETQTWVM